MVYSTKKKKKEGGGGAQNKNLAKAFYWAQGIYKN